MRFLFLYVLEYADLHGELRILQLLVGLFIPFNGLSHILLNAMTELVAACQIVHALCVSLLSTPEQPMISRFHVTGHGFAIEIHAAQTVLAGCMPLLSSAAIVFRSLFKIVIYTTSMLIRQSKNPHRICISLFRCFFSPLNALGIIVTGARLLQRAAKLHKTLCQISLSLCISRLSLRNSIRKVLIFLNKL